MRDLFDPAYIETLGEKIIQTGDKNRFDAAIKDWQAAFARLQDESSVANRRNLQEAEKRHLQVVGEIAATYDPIEEPQPEDPSFPTQLSVLAYLQGEGWKISKSNLNRHCNEKLLRPLEDGTFSRKAVDKYAKTWLKQKATGQKVNERLDRMQEEKLEHDLKTAKFRQEEAEFNLAVKKAQFIPRDEFERAIVSRAVAWMAHLNHAVHSSAADWTDLVGGNQAMTPALVQAITQTIEQRMGDFAADAEFDIILEAN